TLNPSSPRRWCRKLRAPAPPPPRTNTPPLMRSLALVGFGGKEPIPLTSSKISYHYRLADDAGNRRGGTGAAHPAEPAVSAGPQQGPESRGVAHRGRPCRQVKGIVGAGHEPLFPHQGGQIAEGCVAPQHRVVPETPQVLARRSLDVGPHRRPLFVALVEPADLVRQKAAAVGQENLNPGIAVE